MKEIWVNIKGMNGKYQVSNFGNVKNMESGNLISPHSNERYDRITLYVCGEKINKLVHVLVTEHFVSEKPFEKAQVNHKDLNKKNNYYMNLEWTTGSENVEHAIKNTEGRREYLQTKMSEIGSKNGKLNSKKAKKPVEQINRFTGEIIAVFDSARSAMEVVKGSNYKNISDVCTGKKKTHLGYFWKFHCNEGLTTIETTLYSGRE